MGCFMINVLYFVLFVGVLDFNVLCDEVTYPTTQWSYNYSYQYNSNWHASWQEKHPADGSQNAKYPIDYVNTKLPLAVDEILKKPNLNFTYNYKNESNAHYNSAVNNNKFTAHDQKINTNLVNIVTPNNGNPVIDSNQHRVEKPIEMPVSNLPGNLEIGYGEYPVLFNIPIENRVENKYMPVLSVKNQDNRVDESQGSIDIRIPNSRQRGFIRNRRLGKSHNV